MVKLALALSIAVVAALLAGCPPATPFDPCVLCSPDQLCYESCDDGTAADPACEPRPRGCVDRCDAGGAACGEGHPCVEYDDQRACSFECVSSACGGRRECRGSDCQDVECGKLVACLDSADICDAYAYRCFPFDGHCAARSDCPGYDEYWDAAGSVSCTAGYCRVEARPPGPPPGLSAPAAVEVSKPMAGQVLGGAADLQIVWQSAAEAASTSVIVVILDGTPLYKSDLSTLAIWGAAIPSGTTDVLRIADGHVIADGVWGAPATTLPANRFLSLVVQVVKQGELLAVSNVIPFSIGRAWAQRGDACDLADPHGSCLNPAEALSCNPATGTCERVCGSYRDCLGIVPAKDCGVPRGDARYCE